MYICVVVMFFFLSGGWTREKGRERGWENRGCCEIFSPPNKKLYTSSHFPLNCHRTIYNLVCCSVPYFYVFLVCAYGVKMFCEKKIIMNKRFCSEYNIYNVLRDWHTNTQQLWQHTNIYKYTSTRTQFCVSKNCNWT